MEKGFYEASLISADTLSDEKGIKLKFRLLDDHFYDDVYFHGTIGEFISTIEKGEVLYVVKISGERIFINTKLIVDFVLA